ncbi:T-cell immunomodulatory protein [Leucoagaricus sp. SymC.cos]|nr:T-cell immunomodulatory protein [Leucoagaricus sp. SymC.cos]
MLPSLSTRWKTFLCSCLITASLSLPGAAFWPFPKKRFTGTALVDAGTLGLTGDRRVVAFGDFSGDQFLDFLTLGSDQQTFTVFYWNHESFVFQEKGQFTHPTKVLNVVPGDFTHTGKLDLLVMSQGRNKNEIDMYVYPSIPNDGFDTVHPVKIQSSTAAQPIPLDVDGDLKIDLLGGTSDSGSQLQVWQNVWNSSSTNSPLFELQGSHFNGSNCKIANPHSNAVVDLNGDCLADVFLVCDEGNGEKSYQIWLNKKSQGFIMTTRGSLPPGTQSISFGDIDRDGTIDMMFTTCNSVSSSGVGSHCYINIAYNHQLPLCSSTTESEIKGGVRVCRHPSDLCVADDNFKFDLRNIPENDLFNRFPISSLFPKSSLLITDTTYDPPIPLSRNDRTPCLVYSVPCKPGVTGCKPDGSGRRGWSVAEAGTKTLESVKDARGVTFLDMDEDGTLDIMVQRTGSQDGSKILFIQNNFYYDAFFLKAIVLNGACNNGWCYTPNGTERYQPYGVSYSGASYKYTVFDTVGQRSAAQIGQLPQTSYHALQTPYSFFGLGRTNNYIENLFVGTTLHASEHYINMEGVIPNSRVVILPPPDGSSGGWKRLLFLRPGSWVPLVTVTCIAGMVILAIIVFVLHLNEKREDELEKRRASHHINFDAL